MSLFFQLSPSLSSCVFLSHCLSFFLPPSLLQDEEGFDQQSYLVLRHEIEKAHRRISHLQNTPPDRAEPAFLLDRAEPAFLLVLVR